MFYQNKSPENCANGLHAMFNSSHNNFEDDSSENLSYETLRKQFYEEFDSSMNDKSADSSSEPRPTLFEDFLREYNKGFDDSSMKRTTEMSYSEEIH